MVARNRVSRIGPILCRRPLSVRELFALDVRVHIGISRKVFMFPTRPCGDLLGSAALLPTSGVPGGNDVGSDLDGSTYFFH